MLIVVSFTQFHHYLALNIEAIFADRSFSHERLAVDLR